MVSGVAGRAASQLCGAAGVWGTAATAVAGRRGAGRQPEAAHRLARQPTRRTTVGVGDPADTVPYRARDAFPALPGRRVRHRLTPTWRELPPPVAPMCPTGDAARHTVGARRCLARPRRMARPTPAPGIGGIGGPSDTAPITVPGD
jgi:hypothetical protein